MKTYHPTRVKSLVKLVARVVSEDPSLVEDFDRLMILMAQKIPNFHDGEKCLCCGAGMEEYNYKLEALDAILLIQMGKRIKDQMGCGKTFTEANKVRIRDLESISSIKNRTTHASKLGLIAKLESKNGTHVAGTWVITRRGFEALRGETVPYTVTVFRGEILERESRTVSIRQVFNHYKKHRRKIDETIESCISEYTLDDWTALSFYYSKFNK